MKPFTLLNENIQKSASLVKAYHADAADIQAELLHLIDQRILHIMLFGAYNAGKSTLINALVGNAAAKVNDIPTTNKVDAYLWNDMVLLDTPGVNAPIAHENITEAQIKRCGVMLFVIREGDQDTKNLYERLFVMLGRGKKIFIVLNHQATSEQDKQLAAQKVQTILQKLAPRYKVTYSTLDAITIIPMNVQTAFKARVQNHSVLLQHCGYNDFYQAFSRWVTEQKQEVALLDSLKSQVNDSWYCPAMAGLRAISDATDQQNSEKLRYEINTLKNEQRSLELRTQNHLAAQINLAKSQVSQALQNSDNQAILDTQLQQIFMPLGSNIQTWLNKELGDINNRVIVPIKGGKALNTTNLVSQSALSNSVIDGVGGLLKDKEIIKQALLLGRDLKIPLLKGCWEKTLGQWAGKAAIIAQVALFVYDIYRANKEQEAENQRNRQRSIELHQVVEEICATVLQDYLQATQQLINEAFTTQIKALSQDLQVVKQDAEIQRQALQDLTHWQQQMLQIAF